ncbi:retinoic acid early transcript 1E-like [Ictidomys tridecemlineatus]
MGQEPFPDLKLEGVAGSRQHSAQCAQDLTKLGPLLRPSPPGPGSQVQSLTLSPPDAAKIFGGLTRARHPASDSPAEVMPARPQSPSPLPRQAPAEYFKNFLHTAGLSRALSGPHMALDTLIWLFSVTLALLLGPNCFWAAPTGTHSLCLDFTVKSQSRPGESWCEVQVSVDKTPFLQCDCDSNKIKPLGHLEREVNATKTWKQLNEMLKELGQDLRMILLDINVEQKMARGPLTLQAKMSCQLEGKNHIGSSWNFSIDGQPYLCFNVMHMKWTVINPRARGIKEKWENDKELTKHLRKVSMGDCSHWLRELLTHWKEMPTPTSTVPVTSGSPRASSVTVTSLGIIIVLILVLSHHRLHGHQVL